MLVSNIEVAERFRPSYNYLSVLSRRGWAYEYLRRNMAFRKQAYGAHRQALEIQKWKHDIYKLDIVAPQPEAEHWGLLFFPNPEQSSLYADVFWSEATYPNHISVNVTPRLPEETDEIYETSIKHCRIRHLRDLEGNEHILLLGKACATQVRCIGLSLRSANPVKMSFDLTGPSRMEKQFRQIKAASKAYIPCDLNKPQWTPHTIVLRDGLITLDAVDAGLSLREAAEIIYGPERVKDEWNETNRSMKDRMRFRLRKARLLCDGGYRGFLVK
jgi:hypothetical protein